jgi:hypothetical protein
MFSNISQLPAIVVVKPKKSRYAVFEKDINNIKEIKAFVDEVTGGFVQFKPMNKPLQVRGKDDL